MVKLNAKLDADLLIYLLSHFGYDGHTVHMLTQQHLLPPVTRTVKSSLFTHGHSSPLVLDASLHQCPQTIFCYINSGWTFSGQTSLRICIHVEGGSSYKAAINFNCKKKTYVSYSYYKPSDFRFIQVVLMFWVLNLHAVLQNLTVVLTFS